MVNPETPHDIEVLDYERFRARRADPAVAVIDVLPPATYRHGHIAGAVNLPLADVADRAAELLPDRDQEIILYCASFT